MVTLRPYQAQALNTLWSAFQGGRDKTLILMASGLGKTVLAAALSRHWFESAVGKRRILYLAHTVDILRQAQEEFREMLGKRTGLGLYTGNHHEPDAPVVFTTFQKMREWKKAFFPNEFGLVIIDEAHHGQAQTYRETIEYFKPRFLLGMTATPERMDGLDIREIFGEEIYTYPLVQAIADGLLVRVEYHLLTDNLSTRELRKLMKRAEVGDRAITKRRINDTIFLPERDEEVVRLVNTHRQGGARTIIFCQNIEHANEIRHFFSDAVLYHSSLPSKEQDRNFTAFKKGEIDTIIAVDKLNEGVDFPDADLIVFLRATESRTIWLQQLGRGLRRVRGKPQVTVLDFAANCERVLAVAELQRDIQALTFITPDKPDPITVQSTGFDFKFSNEIIDLMKLMERLQRDFYPTLAEAAKAAQRLGISRYSEYKKRYREDPRLPCNPQRVYPDWQNWPIFLGTRTKSPQCFKNCYSTLREASKAAQRLKIKGIKDYRKRYKQNPRLPSAPERVYHDWQNWPHFLKTSNKPRGQHRSRRDFYATLQEASDGARRLEVKTKEEYKKRYREDPRLPSDPNKFYPDWQNWPVFLGTVKRPRILSRRLYHQRQKPYPTLQEASEAAKRLKFKTAEEYRAGYIQDPRLPSSPNHVYPDWQNWPIFLGTATRPHRRYQDFYPTIQEASTAIRKLGIRTSQQYKRYYHRDPRLPSCPQEVYASEWKGWPDFLGTKTTSPKST